MKYKQTLNDIRYRWVGLILLLLAVPVLVVLGAANADDAGAKKTGANSQGAWVKRCNQNGASGSENEYCEITYLMTVKETNQRFVEFAIGYPRNQKEARGVVIVPLGVLLPAGVQMAIDQEAPFKFDVRYCDRSGCVAYVTLSESILGMMRRGAQAHLKFRAKDSKVMTVPVSLKGFTRALEEIS